MVNYVERMIRILDSDSRVNLDISAICSITTNLFHSFINNPISTKNELIYNIDYKNIEIS